MQHEHPGSADAPALPYSDVTEVTLLLPAHEAARLEEAAHAGGLTAGQFLRRLVRQGLRRHPGDGTPAEGRGADG